MPPHLTRLRWLAPALVIAAAAVPYLPTLDDYFIQDDFGVVGLLSQKPASYFPRWFVSTWMDNIWGYTPDEIRPFPAVTYQAAAIWGAASPVANHVINIAFHVVNSLLVLAAGRIAAGLTPAASLIAALMFALLPMQAESVAWITGRVDSMPAAFYAGSFLLYVRWRAGGGTRLYAWSIVLFVVALLSKQNTITLAPALVLFDLIVGRARPRPAWQSIRPYLPYVALTVAYLAFRYLLFGEVVRESALTGSGWHLFLDNLSVHLRRMVAGDAGLQWSGYTVAAVVAGSTILTGVIATKCGWSDSQPLPRGSSLARAAIYFGIVWVALGALPTLVAGYASPRHMYLASFGWTLTLGIASCVLWHGRPANIMRPITAVLTALLMGAYAAQLSAGVHAWGNRAAISEAAVTGIEREAFQAPEGTLLIVGVPVQSWNFALPFALRPPFTHQDVTRRVSVVFPSLLHCCSASQWERYTRETLGAWHRDPRTPPVVGLYWDSQADALVRLSDQDDPSLRSVAMLMAETGDRTALDRTIRDSLEALIGRSNKRRTSR